MGHTLIEDRGDGGSNPSRGRDGRGVRQRLLGAVSVLAARLLGAVAGVFVPPGRRAHATPQHDGDTERDQPRGAVAIRPSGQARLESGPAGPRPDRSTGRGEEPEIAARVRGERLRVYDTDNDEAYVTSDVYERVER